jgi:hypothetical protein
VIPFHVNDQWTRTLFLLSDEVSRLFASQFSNIFFEWSVSSARDALKEMSDVWFHTWNSFAT